MAYSTRMVQTQVEKNTKHEMATGLIKKGLIGMAM